MNRWITMLAALFLAGAAARADVSLPNPLIGDHMVLQAGVPAPVWGNAAPGEKVAVTLDGKTASAVADANGRWIVKLGPLKPGGPHEMVITGRNTLTVRDVLVGEVWVGSGQSNMVWPVSRSTNGATEIENAQHPTIRLFSVPMLASTSPLAAPKGHWRVCSPTGIGNFSGAAYFFGRELNRELKTPVGLIQSAVGGTPIAAWTRREIVATQPGGAALAKAADADIAAAATRPATQPLVVVMHRAGVLYNGMIAPLLPYAIRGVIWYQGEADARFDFGPRYGHNLQSLILDWRNLWANPDLVFLTVQLAGDGTDKPLPGRAGANDGWSLVREGQLQSLRLPMTGLAVSTDIGQGGLHPPNKQDVGKRLARAALQVAYARPIVGMGPIVKSATREGSAVRIRFDSVGSGLQTHDGQQLTGFAVAGKNGRIEWAEARIDGETVVVSAPSVAEPLLVRYGWSRNAACNLANKEGLPASPFRITADAAPAPSQPRAK